MSESYSVFARFYDAMMHDVDYNAWAARLIELIKSYSPGCKDVVDCACGTASITIPLSKVGFRVTGIDLSGDMLMIARERAAKAGCRIPFVQQDISHLALHKPVQVINCSCDGVNYLTSRDKMAAFFRSAAGNLTDAGLLLFDVSTRYKLSAILGGNCFGEDLKECTYLWQNAYDPESKLIEMDLHVFYPQGKGLYARFDEKHIQRAHSDTEIRSALSESGFTVIAAFDGLTEQPLTEKSERALYVCKKQIPADR